jgi:hypothetical protein
MFATQSHQLALPIGKLQRPNSLASANPYMSVAEICTALDQAIAEIDRLRTREAKLMASYRQPLNEYEAALPMKFEEVG